MTWWIKEHSVVSSCSIEDSPPNQLTIFTNNLPWRSHQAGSKQALPLLFVRALRVSKFCLYQSVTHLILLKQKTQWKPKQWITALSLWLSSDRMSSNLPRVIVTLLKLSVSKSQCDPVTYTCPFILYKRESLLNYSSQHTNKQKVKMLLRISEQFNVWGIYLMQSCDIAQSFKIICFNGMN